MSAPCVFPMCVRASRGLLRASSRSTVDIVRTLSTDKPPAGAGSATGGLAQAILQERLQQGQPPPEGGDGEKERGGEQTEDKQKQKENTAYAKKMVVRLAGLMGLGGAVGMVYIFASVNLNDGSDSSPVKLSNSAAQELVK
ncbi:Mitochondrial import inner membrane translocase subunit TIM50 [Collichthys lucidus]|uniref:Mitochondrial import inner membrane translocase subunit TIM50 n=1 Tax=Collichthys lucidus TaxID=240159 RepID=A0A4U5UYU9_COLLU|nr:Mitochondrial import inner membrane translocase subunit TIM50 [Collichthys lucidus]